MMRNTWVVIACAIALTGCQRLVEVRSTQGDMDLVAFRQIIDQIDRDLKDGDLTDGGIVSISSECVYTYHPKDPVTAKELRKEILCRYKAQQKEHPFVIEEIKYVLALQRGVFVRRAGAKLRELPLPPANE